MKRDGPRLRVFKDRLRDDQDRSVLLHGMNFVHKLRADGYVGRWTAEDFAAVESWGLNAMRLGVFWDGLEPEPGRFDVDYIGRVVELVQQAGRYHIGVLVDMHQDLFGGPLGDGAPQWAWPGDPPAEATFSLWSDAYLLSPPVQAAFDAFWSNAPARDRMGLQDHYARAWGLLAGALASLPNVLGYDVMNEPFVGSAIQPWVQTLLERWPELAEAPTASDTDGSRAVTMARRAGWSAKLGLDELQRMAAEARPIVAPFEQGVLHAFYQRIGQAIGRADRAAVLFLEPSVLSNIGVQSAMRPGTGAYPGGAVPRVYAPHLYDLVTDTPAVAHGDPGRTDWIGSQLEATRRQTGWPMAIGEWGAYGAAPDAGEAARSVQRTIERLRCGDFYWCYRPDLPEFPHFASIRRAYPVAVSGRLIHYQADARGIELIWREPAGSAVPTVVYLPHVHWLSEPSRGVHVIRRWENGAGLVAISAQGGGTRHWRIPS